jgi:hypothetical protein
MFRSAIIAAAVAVSVGSAFADEAPARCEDTSFRIYFADGARGLDSTAREMLAVAERNVAGCDYAELRIAIDASAPYATQRAAAITDAADARTWDTVRIEPRAGTRRVSYGPSYAEVTMTPNASIAPPAPNAADTGV